ncbi:CBS domain-containing protein [Vibrio ulleungensis]|uniref:CBS domain-containing protein n=1 Tax=Vibrio ulleungensis TaxID=2807619 RepID=A0ABS2HPR6_9VIBR|nr:CBS domain-containing protein [Vibrio ulleungensis]MBM7038102.1 CBS domain-containing protein [Vibrio ulleungensis]
MIKIEELMTRNPHSLLRSNSLADAKQLMHEKDIRHVPVVTAEGELLGLVTQRDILAAQESSLHEDESLNKYTLSTPLGEAMCKSVMTVAPQAGLRESATYMQKHKVGCLPVVSHKKLVGIITDSDFVTIAINLLELQEEVEPIIDEVTDNEF